MMMMVNVYVDYKIDKILLNNCVDCASVGTTKLAQFRNVL